MPREKYALPAAASHALCALAIFASACGGCGGENNENIRTGTDTGPEPDMGVDMQMPEDMAPPDDMAPPPTDPIGQLNLTWWQSDALYDFPEVSAQAVFSPELTTSGILNPVGWLAAQNGWDVFIQDDYWMAPSENGPVTDEIPTVEGFTTLDAGAFVGTAGELNASLDPDLQAAEGAFVYESLLEEAATYATEEDLSVPLSLFIDGGADISAAELTDVFTMTEPIEITNHDPLIDLPVRYGQDVVVEWTPSADPDDYMIVGLETFDGANYWRLADEDGAANIDSLADEVGARLTDEPTVVLSRVSEQEVQLADGVLQVVAQHKQWLYGRRVGPYEIEPQLWPVGKTTPVRLTWWDGEFTDTAVDAGAGITIENARITDSQNGVLEFDAKVDIDVETGLRDLVAGTDVTFPGAAWVAESLPNAGDCASAVDEGSAADGAYYGTDEGLDFAWFFGTEYCPLMDPEGREQAIPISLQRGQVLDATLLRPDLTGVLYLAKNCDDLDDVTQCTMAPRKNRTTELSYTAFADEDVLLVVDGYTSSDAPPASYIVDIRTTAPRPFDISPREVTDGGSETLAVQSFVGAFDGASTFDFGPDITVDNVELFGDFALVDVTAGDGLGTFADGTPDVTLNIGTTDYTLNDLMTIRPYIAANATCAGADAAGALTTGTYEGLTLLGGTDVVTPVPCLSANADGMEGIFRVDLGPSETVRASVSMPGRDPVIYVVETCGGEVLACTDDGSVDASEYVEWTGPAEPSTVYLVVDGFGVDDSDVFYLDVEVSL